MNRGIACFFSDYLFNGVCIVNSFGIRNCEFLLGRGKTELQFRIIKAASPSTGKVRFFLQLNIKDLNSLSLRFYKLTAHAASIMASLHCLHGIIWLYSTRNTHRNIQDGLTLMSAASVRGGQNVSGLAEPFSLAKWPNFLYDSQNTKSIGSISSQTLED